jgi:hypothetical protein
MRGIAGSWYTPVIMMMMIEEEEEEEGGMRKRVKAPTHRHDTIRDDIALGTKTAVYRMGCAHRRDTREPFFVLQELGYQCIKLPQFLS